MWRRAEREGLALARLRGRPTRPPSHPTCEHAVLLAAQLLNGGLCVLAQRVDRAPPPCQLPRRDRGEPRRAQHPGQQRRVDQQREQHKARGPEHDLGLDHLGSLWGPGGGERAGHMSRRLDRQHTSHEGASTATNGRPSGCARPGSAALTTTGGAPPPRTSEAENMATSVTTACAMMSDALPRSPAAVTNRHSFSDCVSARGSQRADALEAAGRSPSAQRRAVARPQRPPA